MFEKNCNFVWNIRYIWMEAITKPLQRLFGFKKFTETFIADFLILIFKIFSVKNVFVLSSLRFLSFAPVSLKKYFCKMLVQLPYLMKIFIFEVQWSGSDATGNFEKCLGRCPFRTIEVKKNKIKFFVTKLKKKNIM